MRWRRPSDLWRSWLSPPKSSVAHYCTTAETHLEACLQASATRTLPGLSYGGFPSSLLSTRNVLTSSLVAQRRPLSVLVARAGEQAIGQLSNGGRRANAPLGKTVRRRVQTAAKLRQRALGQRHSRGPAEGAAHAATVRRQRVRCVVWWLTMTIKWFLVLSRDDQLFDDRICQAPGRQWIDGGKPLHLCTPIYGCLTLLGCVVLST